MPDLAKDMEFYIVDKMIKEDLDCYIPLVDDDRDVTFIEIPIKARSNDVVLAIMPSLLQ